MDYSYEKKFLEELPVAYSINKIVLNKNNKPIDFEIIEANDLFFNLFEIKENKKLKMKVSEIFPKIKNEDFDWFEFFGNIALKNENKVIEKYLSSLKKWFRIKTFSPEKNIFINFYFDITEEYKYIYNELDYFYSVNLDLFCVIDKKGNFRNLNYEWQKELGYSLKDLENSNILKLIHPDERKDFYKKIDNNSMINCDNCNNYINRIKDKNGNIHYIEWKSQTQGEFTYFSAKDITDKILIEKELKNWQNLMQYIIHYSPNSIAVLDNTLNCIYVSKKFLNEFSLKEVEIINKNYLEVFPETPRKWIETFRRALNGATEKFDEDSFVRLDGSVEYTRWQCVPWLNADNNIGGIIIYIEFITERKKSEDKIKEYTKKLEMVNTELDKALNKVEESSKAKTNFLANMSHEIRTPMNSIIGLTHLAIRLNQNSKVDNYLYKIQKSSNNLLFLINDILDFSKIEAGKMKIEKELFSIKSLIKEVTDMFSFQTEEKGLKFIIKIDKNIPEYLRGDSLKIKQILINLIGNSVKFTNKGYIKLKVIIEEKIKNKIKLLFEIKDTGIGISREKQNSLFQPFQQGDSSNTKKYSGTGLGLSISKKLVELMNGRIAFKSELNKGSLFYFFVILNTNISNKEIDKYKNNLEVENKYYSLFKNYKENITNIEDIIDDIDEIISLVKNDSFINSDLLDKVLKALLNNKKTNEISKQLKASIDRFDYKTSEKILLEIKKILKKGDENA